MSDEVIIDAEGRGSDDLIVDAIEAQLHSWGVYVEHDWGDRRNMAEHILEGLRKNNIGVVTLPEPVGVNGDDNLHWLANGCIYMEQEFDGAVIIADRIGFDAEDLRPVAAALLAAARNVGGQ